MLIENGKQPFQKRIPDGNLCPPVERKVFGLKVLPELFPLLKQASYPDMQFLHIKRLDQVCIGSFI